MQRKTFFIFISFLILTLILAACASPLAVQEPVQTEAPPATSTGSDAGEEKTPIRIGLYSPLTGPVAFLGQGFDKGITLAIEDLGGEIDGHPIVYTTADNKCNPTDAVNAANKLIDVDNVDAIIGGGCSSATVGALPIIGEKEVPSVSATSTNPGIYNDIGAGGNIWAFRINPDDLIMAGGYANYIHDKGVNKIALVAENTDFGRGAMNAYKPIFKDLGVEVTSEDYFDLGTADFRPALTSMKGAGADAVLIVMTENDCANFMRQYREVGVEAAVYSRGACTSPLFLDLTKDNPAIAEGIIEFVFFDRLQDTDLGDRFQARWDTPLTGHRMGGYYAMYHTLAPAIHNLLQEGKEINRENIRDALVKLSLDTPAGQIKFDDHNQAYTDGVLKIVRNGQPELLEIVKLGPVDHSVLK